VSQNFEGPLIARQLATFRWINSALAARSLNEVMKEHLLGDVTLGDLGARQMRGDIPAILFNGSFYNTGRRFVLTATSPDIVRYDLFADLRRSAVSRGATVEFPALSQRMWEGLTPLTPLDLHIDPCPIGVSTAVTASASFPPLVGPITFRVEGDDSYWHVGDGGLYENAGVETLFAAFLKKLQEGKAHDRIAHRVDVEVVVLRQQHIVAGHGVELVEAGQRLRGIGQPLPCVCQQPCAGADRCPEAGVRIGLLAKSEIALQGVQRDERAFPPGRVCQLEGLATPAEFVQIRSKLLQEVAALVQTLQV